MNDLVVAHNCCMARMVEQVCQGGGVKSVKHFERSNGLDTALYKTYLFSF